MALRTPDLPCPTSLSEIQNKDLQWHRIECQLVTPLYGGGVESATVDSNMPIRVASIRGQLRFWWRLLAKHKWKLGSAETIRQAEFALWGGMGKEAHASDVFLKVSNVVAELPVSYTEYASNQSADLAPVFFPAMGNDHQVIPENLKWNLYFRFSTRLQNDVVRQKQVIETLRWWGQFGGLGFRSRRGSGAVHVVECQDYAEIKTVLSKEEVEAIGCQWVTRNPTPNAITAWKTAVKKLRDFRQGLNVGRNPPNGGGFAGRIRWPEPDAIRQLQNRFSHKHKPEHKAGNVFPRGLFGLPIIFKFTTNGDPDVAHLQPKNKERMPSPLLIRPVSNGKGQWLPSALLLPHDHLMSLEVELKWNRSSKNVNLWDDSKAELIKPIYENDATHPLLAFMNYFKK